MLDGFNFCCKVISFAEFQKYGVYFIDMPEGPSAATCINGMWSPDTRPKCVDNQYPMLPKTEELFTT
ncbi:hypothetical protein EB796_000554 [Bugula neritina]|uniref:Uncharacterized protein n=1 Tax=Bugula neritina TaxID=10212 RepID=A0A7J7KS78_BUGNE|nr:hypothetical protein EB796_000734 [Bugula neritina]KAF6041141.1 hypothetical protein EB796_000554 [Bugula neritina]